MYVLCMFMCLHVTTTTCDMRDESHYTFNVYFPCTLALIYIVSVCHIASQSGVVGFFGGRRRGVRYCLCYFCLVYIVYVICNDCMPLEIVKHFSVNI